ncbi:MAG: AAA family ATPase [Bacteroidota bacterium]|nr:AAA family ATPase [Bacteroidota bacterium]
MKILAIRGKNMASLEGLFEIDFTTEPLHSAGIYAITGPTGAGKSTILDTLCLALYAKTPRHISARENGIELQDGSGGKIAQGDVRNILRKGCSDAFAEVVFTGQDGNNHKALWLVRRARNQIAGSLQPFSLELENLNTNTKFGGTKTEILTEIERLIGLNFEQFTRSVLLAQGDFTTFLKADKDAKSSLLEKLTGTDIYSQLSINIYEQTKAAEQVVKDIENQLSGINILSEEEAGSIKTRKEEFDQVLTALYQEKEKIKRETEWHEGFMRLTDSRNKAKETITIALKAKEEAHDRIANFELVEKVQGSRNLFESVDRLTLILQDKYNALETIINKIEILNAKYKSSADNQNQTETKLKLNSEAFQKALPDIEAAKRLDTLILSKTEPVKQAHAEKAELAGKILKHASLLKVKEQWLLDLSIKTGLIISWQKENEFAKPLAENLNFIISKMLDAAKWRVKKTQLNKNILSLSKRIESDNTALETLNKDFKSIEESLTAAILLYNETDEALIQFPVKELEESERINLGRITQLVSAISYWETLYESTLIKEKSILELEKLSVFITESSLKLSLLIVERNELMIKKEQTEKLYNAAQLKTTESVVEMRAQLVNGAPCMVCGSTQHPYKTDDNKLHEVLEMLSKEVQESVMKYQKISEDAIKTEQQILGYEADKARVTNDLKTLDEKIKTYTVKWNSMNPEAACLAVEPVNRLTWLEEEQKKISLNLKAQQLQLLEHKKKKEEADYLKLKIEKLEKEFNEVKHALTNKQSELKLLAQQFDQYRDELESCTLNIDAALQDSELYIKRDQWKSDWQNNPDLFVEELRMAAEEWKQKASLLEDGNKEIILTRVETEGLKNQQKQFEDLAKISETRHEELLAELNLLKAERIKLFEGKSITEIEEHFKNNELNIRSELNKLMTLTEEIQKERNINKGILKQLEGDIENNKILFAKQELDLNSWLQDFNLLYQPELNKEGLHKLLSFSPEWINNERREIKNMDNQLLSAETTFKEREQVLKVHVLSKTTERTLDELNELSIKLNADSTRQENMIKELEFKLKQDELNKKSAKTLLREIGSKREIHEKWAKLNELIGSADGKKFRQIAQEYTLEILLGYANIQLSELTNRYQLACIPDTLALQIIDKDMGDEIRSVHTLSGGESFLVSLALALGLASLSSNKMQVESLFIDEGFGSLDSTTLSIAMDALERLHNQGRKVGVITHVQEMTERIQTQVRVHKLSSGRSKVEVVGI